MKPNYLIKTVSCFLLCISLSVACTNNKNASKPSDTGNIYSSDYICHNASNYEDRIVGDGHCVTLIKTCSNAPNTDQWRPGQPVWQNNIQPGSIIATFKNDRYPSKSGYHAAIYIKQDTQGIWVWDQWQGKSVHQRLIRWRNDNATDANTAQAYKTVLTAYQ